MTDWMKEARQDSDVFHGFDFADGGTLDLRQSYHCLGAKDADGTNAVLMLHGTTGSGKQFLQPSMADFLFGPGRPLDIGDYFIILPDAIGHGASSKPSDGLGPDFPRYGYRDIVAAQHRLVTETLGLGALRLVLGTSMGGMQTWMWGQQFPDMMRALMPIASLPERVSGRNLLWRRTLINYVRSDPDYRDGRYASQPSGVGRAMALFKIMVDSPAHLATAFDGPDAADARVEQTEKEALATEDANDVIWEFDASRDYDPYDRLGGIKAPLLAVNFDDDALNPVELGGLKQAIEHVSKGVAVTLPVDPKSCGHQTLRIAELWHGCVAELLRQSGPASELASPPSGPALP